MTLTPTFLTLYTGAVVAVSFAATLFLLRERLTVVEEAKLILDRVDGADGDGQWWAADGTDQAQAARRRAVVAFWRRALHRRRPGGSRWRSTGPAGDPVPAPATAHGSAAVPMPHRPEADPEVTAYLDAVPPYPAVDYHGRHTATGAYPQVPFSRQAYL